MNLKSKQLTIARMVCVRTGSFQPMPYRPWHTEINDDNTLQLFRETVAGERIVNNVNMATVAGNILRPVAHAQGHVPIAQGWKESRLKFFIEIEVNNSLGFNTRQIITGYSDHEGISLAGNIDRNMRLYFNISQQLRNVRTVSNGVALDQVAITDTSHVIARNGENTTDWRSGFSNSALDSSPRLMRPMDLFGELQLGNSNISGEIHDMRNNVLAGGVQKSRLNNVSPVNYLTRSINALVNAELQSKLPGMDSSSVNIHSSDLTNSPHSLARARATDPTTTSDPFIFYLNSNLSYSLYGYVTMGDLLNTFPELQSRLQMVDVGNARNKTGFAESSEYFDNSTPETVTVNMFVGAAMAAMADTALNNVHFTATNATINGVVNVDIYRVNSFCTTDLTAFAQNFIDKIVTEVFPAITYNGQIPIAISAELSMISHSVVNISYNSGPTIRYEIPTFADSLFAPVLTKELGVLQNTAFDIESLANMVGVNVAPIPGLAEPAPTNHTRIHQINGDLINASSTTDFGV